MNTQQQETVFIIRFRNGMFLSLLDAETPNDYEAMVFDTQEQAQKSLAKMPGALKRRLSPPRWTNTNAPLTSPRRNSSLCVLLLPLIFLRRPTLTCF